MRVRLMEHGFDDEAGLVYEGEWLAVPDIGHEVLVLSSSGGRMLWVVEAVRHVVGVDGRAQHSDLKVRRAG